MNTLWYVPLELLDMRYTIMQDRVTQKAFKQEGINYSVISGETLTSKLDGKHFLNPYSTNYFKFTQLEDISKMFNEGLIKNGDAFYFSDLWYPGIESIKYMAHFAGDRKSVV